MAHKWNLTVRTRALLHRGRVTCFIVYPEQFYQTRWGGGSLLFAAAEFCPFFHQTAWQKLGHFIVFVCSNHAQKPLHKSPKGAWILLHGSARFVWQFFMAARASILMLLVFIFTKTALMTGSKTRCLWTSGMMQSEEFGTVDGLTRHGSEGGFSRQNWDIYINAGWEATDVSKHSPLFLNCYWKTKFYLNSGPRPLGLKTILCTPHRAQVKFIQTISAATVWITLSFSFLP